MPNYVGWVKQADDLYLPAWLKDNLKDTCTCGSPMENYYNDKGCITKRRCANPYCYHKLALKIVGMCDILQVKGIAEATAEKIVKSRGLTNHYAALPEILQEKPRISLYTFLRLSFIEGVDTSWGEVTDTYKTLDDIFASYKGKYRTLLDNNKELLYEGLKYVDVKMPKIQKYKCVLSCTVMLSGAIRGYDNRNVFIGCINEVMDGLVDIRIAEHKRATGVAALIQEKDTPNRGKAEVALSHGIPIMSPDEFKAWVVSEVKKKLDNMPGE